MDSSNARHEAFDRLGKPKSKEDVVKMLGDQSAKVHHVFRDGSEYVKTIAAGKTLHISQFQNAINITNIASIF